MPDQTPRLEDNGLEHLSLPETVRRLLRVKILNNEIAAGSRLVESKLALDFNVSRTTIRQALRQLATEGLVEISPRRHSVVTRLSFDEIQDACYARYTLESGAVRAVLAHGVADLADPLRNTIERMAEAARRADMAAMVDLDTEFHGHIVRAANKPRLASLWATLNAQMGAVIRSSIEEQHIDPNEIVRRHREVLDALRSADETVVYDVLYAHYLRADYRL